VDRWRSFARLVLLGGCCGEGLWLRGAAVRMTVVRGLRCGIVLVEPMSLKSAARPFGIEQVRLLTLIVSTSEVRSYAVPAEGYEPMGHFGKVGRVAGWRWQGRSDRGDDGQAAGPLARLTPQVVGCPLRI
jgi:hypothetical protein